MRFETKVVALLCLIALAPILSSIVLVEMAISEGERVTAEHDQPAFEAVEQAKDAYRELFAARKEEFRALAIAIAATWKGTIGDPGPQFIRSWRVLPNGPSGDAKAAFPEAEWRPFPVRQPLPDGRTLEIEFVARRARFEEFQALDTVSRFTHTTHQVKSEHRKYHWAFVGMFAAVLVPIIASGVWMARRITRRLAVLARAARDVGAGKLDVRIATRGGDEVAELGRAFNEMVGELGESRARIAYLERISAWQEVARRLAHEIKNPLTPIQLAVQELHRKYDGGDAKFGKLLNEVNEIVREEVGTLRRLVEDFSAFARLPRVEPAPLDLGELVADVVRGQPSWAGQVRAVALDEPFVVRADKQLLRRALVNLVENALQAGAKSVEVRADRAQGALRARLIVDDDGPGVADAERTRVFEPYFTTKEHGTGLGLAIVKKIALEHEGDVTLERAPSGGARFVIDLPLG
jgi:nitrogen fixation/metabolism regulation signal transduction histidine kinase